VEVPSDGILSHVLRSPLALCCSPRDDRPSGMSGLLWTRAYRCVQAPQPPPAVRLPPRPPPPVMVSPSVMQEEAEPITQLLAPRGVNGVDHTAPSPAPPSWWTQPAGEWDPAVCAFPVSDADMQWLATLKFLRGPIFKANKIFEWVCQETEHAGFFPIGVRVFIDRRGRSRRLEDWDLVDSWYNPTRPVERGSRIVTQWRCQGCDAHHHGWSMHRCRRCGRERGPSSGLSVEVGP